MDFFIHYIVIYKTYYPTQCVFAYSPTFLNGICVEMVVGTILWVIVILNS